MLINKSGFVKRDLETSFSKLFFYRLKALLYSGTNTGIQGALFFHEPDKISRSISLGTGGKMSCMLHRIFHGTTMLKFSDLFYPTARHGQLPTAVILSLSVTITSGLQVKSEARRHLYTIMTFIYTLRGITLTKEILSFLSDFLFTMSTEQRRVTSTHRCIQSQNSGYLRVREILLTRSATISIISAPAPTGIKT